jgi:hypothetical protein
MEKGKKSRRHALQATLRLQLTPHFWKIKTPSCSSSLTSSFSQWIKIWPYLTPRVWSIDHIQGQNGHWTSLRLAFSRNRRLLYVKRHDGTKPILSSVYIYIGPRHFDFWHSVLKLKPFRHLNRFALTLRNTPNIGTTMIVCWTNNPIMPLKGCKKSKAKYASMSEASLQPIDNKASDHPLDG